MKNILKGFLSSEHFQEGAVWKRHHYKAKTVIVKKGDIGKTLFFVEKGKLKVTGIVELDDLRRIHPGVGDLESGTIFGEICLHHSQTRMATVTAATDVELLEINGESLSVYLDDNPVQGYLFYKGLFEIMIKRLGGANQRIENLMAWGLKIHDIDKFL